MAKYLRIAIYESRRISFKRLFKVLFRYDVFISYARRDGKGYVLKLKEQLTRLDFSCFLDYEELPAGLSQQYTETRSRAPRSLLSEPKARSSHATLSWR